MLPEVFGAHTDRRWAFPVPAERSTRGRLGGLERLPRNWRRYRGRCRPIEQDVFRTVRRPVPCLAGRCACGSPRSQVERGAVPTRYPRLWCRLVRGVSRRHSVRPRLSMGPNRHVRHAAAQREAALSALAPRGVGDPSARGRLACRSCADGDRHCLFKGLLIHWRAAGTVRRPRKPIRCSTV